MIKKIMPFLTQDFLEEAVVEDASGPESLQHATVWIPVMGDS